MEIEFKQELKGDSILVNDLNCLFGTKGLDYWSGNLKANIDYSVSLDVRTWGIDSISLSVSKIVVSANINIDKEWLNADEIELLKLKGFKEYKYDYKLLNWDLSFFNYIKVEEDILQKKQISINELYVDFLIDKDSVIVNCTLS